MHYCIPKTNEMVLGIHFVRNNNSNAFWVTQMTTILCLLFDITIYLFILLVRDKYYQEGWKSPIMNPIGSRNQTPE